MRRLLHAAAALLALTAAPVAACDIAVPDTLRFTSGEKVPGWTVYVFTAEAPADGHMLFTRANRRDLPRPADEKAFLEPHLRKAVAALFKRPAESLALDGPSVPDPAKEPRMRAFTATATVGGTEVALAGYMRVNVRPRNMAVIVAITTPDDREAAGKVARQLASHPGFECTAGDGP